MFKTHTDSAESSHQGFLYDTAESQQCIETNGVQYQPGGWTIILPDQLGCQLLVLQTIGQENVGLADHIVQENVGLADYWSEK